MKVVGVIPVRLASTRFPGKALASVNGKAMVLHVWERARLYERFERLIVATDDESIRDLIKAHGGEVFFSKADFRNGSERCAAAIASTDCDVCIDVQGDEVTVLSDQLEATVTILESDQSLQVTTAGYPIPQNQSLDAQNLVKVAVDDQRRAIDFSRKPILISGKKITNYGHAGIYAYRRDFLIKYAQMPPTTREVSESLEQLRILENGYNIGVAIIDKPLISVNTPEDLAQANKLLSEERGVIK